MFPGPTPSSALRRGNIFLSIFELLESTPSTYPVKPERMGQREQTCEPELDLFGMAELEEVALIGPHVGLIVVDKIKGETKDILSGLSN